MKTVEILKCNCKHEYQDQVYGTNMRVHNRGVVKGTKENPYAEYTCTVCGKSQQVNAK